MVEINFRKRLALIEDDLNRIHGVDSPSARSFRPSWEFQRRNVLRHLLDEQLKSFDKKEPGAV